jgi:hypothetical protein
MRENRDVAPPIQDLGNRREWLVNTILWPLYRLERETVHTLEEAKGNNDF